MYSGINPDEDLLGAQTMLIPGHGTNLIDAMEITSTSSQIGVKEYLENKLGFDSSGRRPFDTNLSAIPMRFTNSYVYFGLSSGFSLVLIVGADLSYGVAAYKHTIREIESAGTDNEKRKRKEEARIFEFRESKTAFNSALANFSKSLVYVAWDPENPVSLHSATILNRMVGHAYTDERLDVKIGGAIELPLGASYLIMGRKKIGDVAEIGAAIARKIGEQYIIEPIL